MPSERDPAADSAVGFIDLSRDAGWVEIDDRLRSFTGEVRVVVVRAPGGLRGALISYDAASPANVRARESTLARLAGPDVIYVAAVAGRCEGVGLAVALGCDLRVAADDADFAFSSMEVFGVLGRLAAAVGQPRALELCLTGRRMTAAEAAAVGLVNLVVGGQVVDGVDDLTAAVHDLTAALLATPRELATELKRALHAASSGSRSAAHISLSEEIAAIVRLAGDDEVSRER